MADHQAAAGIKVDTVIAPLFPPPSVSSISQAPEGNVPVYEPFVQIINEASAAAGRYQG